MADQNGREGAGKQGGGFIGSLREALAAASKEDTTRITTSADKTAADGTPSADAKTMQVGESVAQPAPDTASVAPPPLPSAAEAAAEARGGTPNIPPVETAVDRHVEFEPPPTTRVVRQAAAASVPSEPERTQLVRGRPEVERGEFRQDPVVGWLVIVGGPGIGSYRPIFEGNNTVGRSSTNRIAIDFGDDTISSEEQAYIRYDSANRAFLFVPNMAKTNIVSVNDDQPTSAIRLQTKDVIRMGRTQLVFVAFCGPDFDWSELAELKKA
jgi:hypothetical protein